MRFRKALLPDGSVKYSASLAANPTLIPPAPPGLPPDGSVAAEPQMFAAMFRFRVYNSDVENYLQRLEFEERHGRIDRATRNRLHNQAVDTLQEVVGRFNLQLRIFKARQSYRLVAGGDRRH